MNKLTKNIIITESIFDKLDVSDDENIIDKS